MECEEVKKIIPQYFQHTASEEEIQAVEEHLCVCHDCRTVLGELMDKVSTVEEAVETPSQDQPESLPEEKPQEEVVENKEEGVEYFPGKDLEESLDKVDDILGKIEPAKGDTGDKPEEVEPIVLKEEEEKIEEKDEESSFEVIVDPPAAPLQELPVESDIEALSPKGLEPIKEEKAELPLEEVKEELPPEEEKVEEKTELPREEEKAEEKVVFSFEEDKVEETIEEIKEEPKEEIIEEVKEEAKEEIKEEEAPAPSLGKGIELKKEEQEESAPKKEDTLTSLEESRESQESLEETSYSLDGAPLEKSGVSLLEYLCLVIGLGVLGVLAYLLLKG